MTKQEVRIELAKAGLRQYQLADAMGICESALSKTLRKPLSDKQAAEIMQAIKTLTAKTA